MTCTRHFGNWDRPALQWAADWIIERFVDGAGCVNLLDTKLVLPGKRASRTLLGNLVDHCAEKNLVLIPPLILTPLEIPSTLLGVPGLHASKISRRLAWIETLNTADPESIATLTPTSQINEGKTDWAHWSSLAGWIERVSTELCDAGHRMKDVVEHVPAELESTELVRWQILAELQEDYEHRLSALGVVDDRLSVLEHLSRDEPIPQALHTHMILIGLAELGSIARNAMERTQCVVDSLVFAPESLASSFDELGCVAYEQWEDTRLEIEEHRIEFSADTDSMCESALVSIANSEGIIDTASCVIGLGDETLIGSLERKAALAADSVSIHSAAGTNASMTTPGKLISRIQTHLSERTFDTFMGLIRHPAIEQSITQQLDENRSDTEEEMTKSRPHAYWLNSLDLLRQEHVQTGGFQIPTGTKPSIAEDARAVHALATALLQPLLDENADGSLARPLDEWCTRLSETLQNIYTSTNHDSEGTGHQSVIDGLRAVRRVFDEIVQAKHIGQSMPEVTAPAALGVVLNRLNEFNLPEATQRNSIETLGWLELMLDPSTKCVIIGMTDSSVPGAITHDPLLPGSLRASLGMATNEQRLARDVYLMAAINASRDTKFICARIGDQGDPVTPSRLLLKTDGHELANRIQRFVTSTGESKDSLQLTQIAENGSEDRFAPLLRVDSGYSPPTSMRVTDFDAYLRSPAEWYLQRVKNLNDLDLSIRELSPPLMGNLLHAVFEGFGKDPSMKDLEDPGEINKALRHLLEECTNAQFGTPPPAAVQVQFQLLRYRLAWFALGQSKRRREGWRIEHTEWSPQESERPSIIVDNEPMQLRGKIDRIDIHEDGRIAIIDYKTGKYQNARNAHFTKDHWIKLQLPLYRHLASSVIGQTTPILGYAGLPSKDSEKVMDFAEWTQDELRAADEAAARVVREIRSYQSGDQIPLGDSPPKHGVLGFLSGERFESGGVDVVENTDDFEEHAAEVSL